MTATKTIRLTKTERALLEKAARNHRGRVSACRAYGYGCKGIEGTRATDALVKLRDKGLVDELTSSSGVEYHRGNSTHFTEVGARITEAGRAALEAGR